MNPWGLFIIIIGLLLIVVGVKGSQHTILTTMKNAAHI